LTIQIPKSGRRTRWLATLCGVLIFLWLTPEDNHVEPVVALGTLTSVMVVWLWSAGKTIPARWFPAVAALLGATTGLGASLITALLMLIKNVQHSHVFLDFPPGMIGAIIQRAPAWMLAGALIGIGLALLKEWKTDSEGQNIPKKH
jgi:hypothetical protein